MKEPKRSRIIAVSVICVVLVTANSGCAAGMSDESYPGPPDVGTPSQQEALARLARDAVTENYPSRRLERLLELRNLIGDIARESDSSTVRDEIGRYLAQTCYVAISNGDHYHGRGVVGGMPGEVTSMKQHVPGEMVALRMTEPRHWVEGLYPKMTWSGGVASDMIEAAGGFEQVGPAISAWFVHINRPLGGAIRQLAEDESFDPLINALMQQDRYNATYQLLRMIAPGRKATDEEVARELELRRRLLMMEVAIAEEGSRWGRWLTENATLSERLRLADQLPLNPENQSALLYLAEQPEWPIHIYVWAIMRQFPLWRDPAVIDAIAAHQNPVSLRFLAHSGMIDPFVTPVAGRDSPPPRRGTIPTSQPASRPPAVQVPDRTAPASRDQ